MFGWHFPPPFGRRPRKRPRYIVFEFDQYYPSGGMGDAMYRVNNLDELQAQVHDFRDVLDLDTGEWVEVDPSAVEQATGSD